MRRKELAGLLAKAIPPLVLEKGVVACGRRLAGRRRERR